MRRPENRQAPVLARRVRGVSLLEVTFALGILAVGLLLLLGILPTGVSSVKRSEDIEAATAYGMELIEDARRSLPPVTPPLEMKITFNRTEFKMRREIVPVDADLTDVVVTATWSDTLPGIRLTTRVQGRPKAPPSASP